MTIAVPELYALNLPVALYRSLAFNGVKNRAGVIRLADTKTDRQLLGMSRFGVSSIKALREWRVLQPEVQPAQKEKR